MNLSGSPITIGRARTGACRPARAAASAVRGYAAAGEGESSTDLAWDGQEMIWRNGVQLAGSERFPKVRGDRSPMSIRAALGAPADGHLRRQPSAP